MATRGVAVEQRKLEREEGREGEGDGGRGRRERGGREEERGSEGGERERERERDPACCNTHLVCVDVESLERVDGDQDISHVRVDMLLLISLPQVRHYHILKQEKENTLVFVSR